MARRKNPEGPLSGTVLLYPINEGPQEAFVTSEAEEVLYGGAAAGGKSYALRAYGVHYCLTYPGARVVLFRRTYRELEETHILAIYDEVPSAIATYDREQHVLKFANGSLFFFRYCERPEDARSYDTTEFDAILFDELTAFGEFEYTYLLSRCRSTKPWWPGRRIRAATNPGNVGHAWVKRRWIDFVKPYEIRTAPVEEGGLTRQFIPARVTDNPALMAKDPRYMEALKALPPDEYRAKALGDWAVYSGQFFSMWRADVHVVEDFSIPGDWSRSMAVDFGYAVPYACYWAARPPGTDSIWIYREHYGAGVPIAEQIRRAREASRDEKIEFIVVDPAMFARSKDEHGRLMKSHADLWKEGFPDVPVIKGNNERIPGAILFQEVLSWTADPDGKPLIPPRLHFFRSCEHAIRTIPALQRSDALPEDVDTKGEDHAYDAIRYLLRALFSSPKPSHRKYVRTPRGILAVG